MTLRLLLVFGLMMTVAPRASAQDDDPAVLRLAEPDFTLVALPTSLRVPVGRAAFRVTHRFTRSLGQGDFGDLAEDLFGIDAGAQIGLEFRFGVVPNGQVGIHRTSDKTIEFFGEYSVARQAAGLPLDISALVTIDGPNNFRGATDDSTRSYSPAVGAILSRTVGEVAAFYLEPLWVNNTNDEPSEIVDDNSSFVLGVGGRIRIRPTVYLVGEVTPRLAGYARGTPQGSVAIEKRAGGHTFQLNFSNGFGTTIGQVARGASNADDWYMGFNISRKFF